MVRVRVPPGLGTEVSDERLSSGKGQASKQSELLNEITQRDTLSGQSVRGRHNWQRRPACPELTASRDLIGKQLTVKVKVFPLNTDTTGGIQLLAYPKSKKIS